MIPCRAMQLARRAQRMAESATVGMTRRAAELRAAGRDIVDLSAGQPDFPSPPVAVEAARQALADGFTHYTVAAGIPDLRNALAERYHRRYGSPWELPNTLVTVGAKSALWQLTLALLDEGTSAVYPTPAWVSFPEQMRFAGAEPIPVPMDAADGFSIRAEPLIDALRPSTRMVLVNSPCNPTGGTIEASELRRLAEACAERDIVLLNDETYEYFVYEGQTHASAASLAEEFPNTVAVVSSFSKTYAMTGWRIGWAMGPRALIDKAAAIQGHATSNPTSFAMVGALAALRHADDDVVRMIRAFEERRDLIVTALDALPGFECHRPHGAFYAFPDVSQLLGNRTPASEGRSLDLAEQILEEAGVALVPGLAFGDDRYLRLSFASDRRTLQNGIARLRRFVDALAS